SITTSRSLPVSERTTSGTSATRRSPSAVSFGTPIRIQPRPPAHPGPAGEAAAAYPTGEDRRSIAGPMQRGSGRLRGAGERGQALDRVEALAWIQVGRRDDDPVHPDLGVALDPLADLVLGADERGGVGQLVGDRRVRLV